MANIGLSKFSKSGILAFLLYTLLKGTSIREDAFLQVETCTLKVMLIYVLITLCQVGSYRY